jgi:phosphatidylserine/phosphatidylglycerophosphate/cardiolipin synthase-like enzyme
MYRLHLNATKVILFVWFIIAMSFSPIIAASFPSTGTTDVYFSPDGGCTEAIVKELNSAKSEILVQAYSFTSTPIAKALVNAKKRGVNITVVLDKSQRSSKYSSADFVANAGTPTFIDAKHAIAHNKIMIIDRGTLITGSFNFTQAAEEKNAENLLIIKGNKPLVDAYIKNFNEHKEHSEVYVGRMSR